MANKQQKTNTNKWNV